MHEHLPLANDCEITLEGRIHHFEDAKMEAALAGGVKRGAGNALDFHDAVPLGVVSLRAILPLAAATLAKVNATGQFAHHHQVKALCHDV